MTTTERLIRNICEQKRGELITAKSKELETIEQEVDFASVPKRIQSAMLEHAKITERAKVLSTLVDGAGYDMPRESCSCDGEAPKKVQKDYALRQRENSAIAERFEKRFSRIAQLKHEATVATLGKTNAEGKPFLETLQKELGKA